MSTKPTKPQGSAPMIKGSSTAPMVYFDNVPVMGTFSGNIEVELSARALMPKPDGNVVAEMNCTAHLRCSAQAALMLIDALQKAIGMLERQQADMIREINEIQTAPPKSERVLQQLDSFSVRATRRRNAEVRSQRLMGRGRFVTRHE